jgi:single-strand DNA-binding protein
MPTNELKMPDVNRLDLCGRLTRNPEGSTVGTAGATVCKFGIAHNKKFKTASGEQREETMFFNVVTWGKQADYCTAHLKKGYPVLIEGRLSQNSWDDKQTGETKTVTEITAHRVQSLTWDNASGTYPATPAPAGGGESYEPKQREDVPF